MIEKSDDMGPHGPFGVPRFGKRKPGVPFAPK